MHTLRVELDERSYPIYIGRDLLSNAQLVGELVVGSQIVIVTNETVAPIYLEKLSAAVSDRQLVTQVILPDGEQYKTLEVLESIFDRVMTDKHNRNTTFVALGGGVVGDVTGFAAACYQRGVDFIQVPTTLLAQVDSSVGGKTAVNHPLGKNMIGAFHQPRAVVIDIKTLETLPPREFSAGLAEVVKYGLITDKPFYHWLKSALPQLLMRDEATLAEAIQRSCAAKAAVVAADEREGGVRAILNLGHTFGHAIETHQGYGKWLHGEAVAAGMVMALQLSAQRGWVSSDEVTELEQLLSAAKLPVAPPSEMTTGVFLDLMSRDKKVVDGRLRLILLKTIGEAVIVDDVDESELTELIARS